MTGHDPATLAMRDALLAALRNAQTPLTADELAPLMPKRIRIVWTSPRAYLCADDHRRFREDPRLQLVECRGRHQHLVAFEWLPAQLYTHLQELATAGVVQRHRQGHGSRSRWSWVDPFWTPGQREDEAQVDREFHELTAGLDVDGGEQP